MNNLQITIKAMKYGNRPHYEWQTTLLEMRETYIIVLGEQGRKLHHYTKKQIFTVENWTIEFFPFDSWFTVSADVVNGTISQYYCNINVPAKIDGNIVSFVDLDLDYIQRGGKWQVVDEEEFERNAIIFSYPDELIQRARKDLNSLQERIERKQFPFDGTLESFINRIPSK
jgi:protein associated with RNAse G/E